MRHKPIIVALASVVTMIICAACGSSSTTSASSAAQVPSFNSLKGKTLVVASWGGTWTATFQKYFANPFAKATGVKFSYVIQGIDPNTPVLLQEQAHDVKIDLVDSGLGAELQAHGDLATFPASLHQELLAASTPGTVYPGWWTYGTVPNMIVCNPHIVKVCPTTPAEFFNVKKYPGARMMTTDPREMGVFALEAAGVSHHTIATNPPIGLAMNMLHKIKPYVKVWASSGSQQQQAMASREVGIAVMWESRVVPMYLHGYSYWKVSWTGAESESDFAFLVPKGAPDADVSFAFLKWIALHPKNQAGFSAAIGTFTPGKDVLKYVPKDLISWQPQSHASQVFYWPSLPWVKRATELQNAWQSAVG